MDTSDELSPQERTLLRAFMTQGGPSAIGLSFRVVGRGKTRYLKSGTKVIGLNLSDEGLDRLSALGYVHLRLQPLSVVFTPKVLSEQVESPERAAKTDSMRLRVENLGIRQAYAWLAMSILAALVALVLLVMAVWTAIQGSTSVASVSAISTLVSGFLARVFYRQWETANRLLGRADSEQTKDDPGQDLD